MAAAAIEPTVTDANLVLGRLAADAPLGGAVALDRDAAWGAVASLAKTLGLEALACAEGIVRVAEAEMLRALRVMTVQRGVDPRGFALMGFGGAGPLHAAAMAEELGITRVLCPRASGVLSALGLAAAPARRDVSQTVMLAGSELNAGQIGHARDLLLARAREQLERVAGGRRAAACATSCATQASRSSFPSRLAIRPTPSASSTPSPRPTRSATATARTTPTSSS